MVISRPTAASTQFEPLGEQQTGDIDQNLKLPPEASGFVADERELSFPKNARLRNAREFARVFEGRKSVADDNLVLYAAPNGDIRTRLGLVVSRKVGNAEVRNRWKRLLREAFRLSQSRLPPGLDLVALPRVGQTPELLALQSSLVQLTKRLVKKLERSR